MNLRCVLKYGVAGWLVWGWALAPAVAQRQFFDDFRGPVMNRVWQATLPDNAYSGSFPFGASQTAHYLGAPHFQFESLAGNSVVRLHESMDNLSRVGWSTTMVFGHGDFYYDVRFNSLAQTSTTSIDGFIEIWLIDAANRNHYDIVSPFGGSYDGAESFFTGSSIDGQYTETPFTYQNNTWYHLVLQSVDGQNIRASIYDDHGTELIGRTLQHNSTAFKSGFRLGLSQLIGFAQGVYPVDVAVDYARLSVSTRQIRQNRDSLVQLAVLMPDQAAVVPVTPAPVLVLKRSPGGLTLQWPLSATGMVLETTATLAPADWAPVTNTPIPVGDQVELQIPTTNASQFFQLHPAGN